MKDVILYKQVIQTDKRGLRDIFELAPCQKHTIYFDRVGLILQGVKSFFLTPFSVSGKPINFWFSQVFPLVESGNVFYNEIKKERGLHRKAHKFIPDKIR